jgi:hypothetical protein
MDHGEGLVAYRDDVAGAKLAAAAGFGLTVDRYDALGQQRLGLAAAADDAGELQELTEADGVACYRDVAQGYGPL